MNRFASGAATAAVTAVALAVPALVSPSHAQTAPPGPVTALKKQFVPGRGVKITEKTESSSDDYHSSSAKKNGVVGFNRSGPAGHDILIKSDPLGKDTKPGRILAVGSTRYGRGGLADDILPKGKKWLRVTSSAVPSPFTSPIYMLEPATLNTLLTTASSTSPGADSTTVYKGALTGATLYRVSPSYRSSFDDRDPTEDDAAMEVRWTLWIGRDRLPRRLVSTWRKQNKLLGTVKTTSDIRLSGWGTRVTLTRPPADQVTP
ncbi:hypothetical protein [Planobispora takensis]|uniref:Lipoprotein n=1 Tax=Planobispora takensis TaxID=1367882 RepID=A0A8J3T9N4_9ACTN|nr:hypothetical protein [Planobispora takensis]GII03454.1 hypothetical protein Pta02_54620 [Planobispora takensis]